MIFASLPLDRALGAILAHTHHLGPVTLRKGTRLGAAELEHFRAVSHTEVVVATLEAGDLDEDQAAARVAATIAGPEVDAMRARTGRANLHAGAKGVLVVDAARVDALNLVSPAVTLATRTPWSSVEAGEMVATVKIIPYAVPAATVEQACGGAGELLRVAPFARFRVGAIASTLPGTPPRMVEATVHAQRQRVSALGSEVVRDDRVPHDEVAVAAALRAQLEAGVELVLFMGASAIVDLEDVLPRAIRAVGGEVDHLGMPVDPGNLTLLGRCGEAVVLGVPGCARSPKRSGFDQVLERVVARIPTTGADLQRMGVGGLLKDIADRPHPRAPAPRRPRIGAVVLAAGLSSRMGSENKLLVELDGRPLVTWAVDALLEAGIAPVVVVTGRAHDAIVAALADRAVVVARNPAPEAGMSRSLAEGLGALDPAVDGFFVMLGDVPFVRAADVAALVTAFDPDAICVPVHERRRGHPVLWAARFREELLRLEGDVGARAVLDAHADAVRIVLVDNPGISVDIDTPAALADARTRKERP